LYRYSSDRRRIDPGIADNSMPAIDDKHNPQDVPGNRVRQQTLDLVGPVRALHCFTSSFAGPMGALHFVHVSFTQRPQCLQKSAVCNSDDPNSFSSLFVSFFQGTNNRIGFVRLNIAPRR
jgi:hypothetical protein